MTKAALDRLKTIRDEHGHMLSSETEAKADEAIGCLVSLGHWPAKNQTGQYTAKQMWECYGIHWNAWSEPWNCPHCEADLRELEDGPPFKREIGIIINDICRKYKCPDCGKSWPRHDDSYKTAMRIRDVELG